MAPWIVPVIEFLTELVRFKRAKAEQTDEPVVAEAPAPVSNDEVKP
jgi:hypothetical protein